MNSVKVYSNGSAVISKGYKLNAQGVKVTIPVKKDDLDDVVSSLTVNGNVTLPDPPNYTPNNSTATSLTLNATNVLRELATKLRGAEAKIERVNGTMCSGRVFGIQTYQQETNGSVFERFRILLGTADGILQFDESDIKSLNFTDDFVKSEIDKSLASNFAAIKPDSRNVELTIVPNAGAEFASVSYATPCAAWKTRYQLRILKGEAVLERQAVVDNDTDDDWKEVTLSVITGEPISFSTDIADIRRPTRGRVNIVSDSVTGAVGAEETILGASGASGPVGSSGSNGRRVLQAKSATRGMAMMTAAMPASAGGYETYGDDALESSGVPYSANFESLQAAPIQAADIRESGDFSVFTAPNPVTILSRRSAIIGLDNLPLENAKTVLLYKPNKNERRPYTAVKFNATTSLSKGACEVYVDGDRQGKCILETVKEGDEVFLVHALETGVKVFRESGNVESRRIRVKIADGVIYCEQLTTQQTNYRIQNSKGENFQFEIEHARQWGGSKLSVAGQQTSVDTPTGCRVGTTLPANGTLIVTVTETLVQNQQYGINPNWLQSNFVAVDHPLGRNKSIQAIIEAQGAVNEIQGNIDELDEEASVLVEEQERLLALIPKLHADQANASKNDLAEAEVKIKDIKKVQLPQLRKNLKKAEAALQDVMSKLKTEWADEDVPPGVVVQEDK